MAEGETLSEMSETDVTTFKKTLQAQQQLLQTLYAELDQEREASASAASEALSMILRLQGEKAAVKMEASQYKRLAEEKMCHAEESLAIFEDLIYQKEMEIASLEFQVQAYKCKLLSLGCNDVVSGENRFPEHLFFQGSDPVRDETCGGGNVKRFSSLPLIPVKDSHQKKGSIEGQKSAITLPNLVQKIVEKKADHEISIQSMDSEMKSGHASGGNFDSYWQQIKVLDEQVKEISHSKDSGRDGKNRARSCSLPPPVTIDESSDSTILEVVTASDDGNHDDNVQEREEIVSSSCSSSVQDIFEVPKLKKQKTFEQRKEGQNEAIDGAEHKPRDLDLASQEIGKSCLKVETTGAKKLMQCKDYGSNLTKPRNEIGNVAPVHPPTGVAESQAQFQQLRRRVEQLEGERNGISQEITCAGEEERRLLREIHEQLNTIQTELYSWRKKKTKVQDDQCLEPLREAMLYFWI